MILRSECLPLVLRENEHSYFASLKNKEKKIKFWIGKLCYTECSTCPSWELLYLSLPFLMSQFQEQRRQMLHHYGRREAVWRQNCIWTSAVSKVTCIPEASWVLFLTANNVKNLKEDVEKEGKGGRTKKMLVSVWVLFSMLNSCFQGLEWIGLVSLPFASHELPPASVKYGYGCSYSGGLNAVWLLLMIIFLGHLFHFSVET